MRSPNPPGQVRFLRAPSPALVVGAVIALLGAACLRCAAGEDPYALPDDSVAGWRVFTQKQCIRCHSVWGVGGQVGSDLGRTSQEHFTASELAGALWNHIPRMHSYMSQNRLEYPILSLDEMRDIFGFLFFVRQLEEPGDGDRGERILTDKGCLSCHFAGERPGADPALELRRWGSHANPVVWAQKIWQHAPKMQQAMKEADIVWPKLDDRDLVDIVAYVRSLGTDEATVYLKPGSPRKGSQLFSERKCRSCHVREGPAPDLANTELPGTVTGLASRIWNHLPEMTRLMEARGEERSDLTAQEMADVISYLLVLRYWDETGDAQRGRSTFQRHRCTSCHQEEDTASSSGPAISALASSTDPVRFAHALWNHGGAMLEVLSEQGATWPVLKPGEVPDLISYLKSLAEDETPVGTLRPKSPQIVIPVAAAPHVPPETGEFARGAARAPLPPPGGATEGGVSGDSHVALVAGREGHRTVGQHRREVSLGPGGDHSLVHTSVQDEPRKHAPSEFHDAGQSEITGQACAPCHGSKGPGISPGTTFDFANRKDEGTLKHFPLPFQSQ